MPKKKKFSNIGASARITIAFPVSEVIDCKEGTPITEIPGIKKFNKYIPTNVRTP